MPRFDNVSKVVLIGGGDLIVHAERCAKNVGFDTSVILSPRHLDEILLLEDHSLEDELSKRNVEYFLIDDINTSHEIYNIVGKQPALGFGFGPTWIFSKETRAAFSEGMINFHGIPIPRYLGGAHATWQILNGDRSGGCIIQCIEDRLDRGAILRSEYFDVPARARTPIEYQIESIIRGKKFLECFLADAASGCFFEPRPFADLEPERLYWPRLYTPAHAFIDWNWNVPHIERFIRAFDAPYPGARTFLGEALIILRSAYLDNSAEDIHPFAAGLIVRRHQRHVWIAANGGLVRVESVTLEDGSDAYPMLKEGVRLHTPRAILEDSNQTSWNLTPFGFNKLGLAKK